VVVTGRVADVRPYLQYAAVVVAPLRVARGVQNKVLEAMAMGRPAVVSRTAGAGIEAEAGAEVALAEGTEEFEREVLRLLDPNTGRQMGSRARQRILSSYRWEVSLQRFDGLLGAPESAAAGVRVQPEAA
jgi:glycosyltransferase involved in cell wall biosynthesis